MVDPITAATFLLKYAPTLYSAIRPILFKDDSLAKLAKQVDQLLIRELRAAYTSIEYIKGASSADVRERHLQTAEAQLLNGIALGPNLTTAGKPNPYWVARAHFGLSLIHLVRQENNDALTMLLRAVIHDPIEAKDTFASQLWKDHVLPKCTDIYEDYQAEVNRLPEYKKRWWQLAWKLGWSFTKTYAVVGGVTTLAIMSRRYGAVSPLNNMVKKDDASREELIEEFLSIPNQKILDECLTESLRSRTVEVVTEMLDKHIEIIKQNKQ